MNDFGRISEPISFISFDLEFKDPSLALKVKP